MEELFGELQHTTRSIPGREKNPSVWVDIHSSLFDPKRAHHMYNDFMDELEFAASCGFDAVCVNEHHSNGYGLMPSPNLIASILASRTSRAQRPQVIDGRAGCLPRRLMKEEVHARPQERSASARSPAG